jgi:hypothetical protein
MATISQTAVRHRLENVNSAQITLSDIKV